MSVRAKFTVNKIEISRGMRKVRTEDGNDYVKDENDNVVTEPAEMRTVVLNPVYANNDPKHENTRFWDYSPSGEIRLGTINPEAYDQFEVGKEYYIDFTPVSNTN